jgi:hypothetical protein
LKIYYSITTLELNLCKMVRYLGGSLAGNMEKLMMSFMMRSCIPPPWDVVRKEEPPEGTLWMMITITQSTGDLGPGALSAKWLGAWRVKAEAERDNRHTRRGGGWSHGASSQGRYMTCRDGTRPQARNAEKYDERRAL